ncbi:helix-turn-helix domain-containing protein [Alcaligenes faecalis]|uniref:helix-turn-helix domain-containing protein n=1 Tax=Alcaligenes faecalis TaxID=511 RepID=UPI0029334F1A|nr:XRE family transcriptional regulator [Alcaligenes faecalis]MDV2116791.1 XRE family transcriptional regulator [Alcaligenes faecalis]
MRRNELLSKEQVGVRLRQARHNQKQTLKQVSEKTGLALSTISKAELGQVTLSYEKFVVLARALNIEVGSLFAVPDAQTTQSLPTRKVGISSHKSTAVPGYATRNYEYGLLFGELSGKHMTPILAVIDSRDASEFDDYIRHAGQEFVIVLSGAVAIQFETGETLFLDTHESAYFDSGIGHIYVSTSEDDAKVVAVCTSDLPPGLV